MGNVAYILKPKQDVAYISDHITVRQALERMRHKGYTEVPVLHGDGRYVGTVSEGDFLWFILDSGLEGDSTSQFSAAPPPQPARKNHRAYRGTAGPVCQPEFYPHPG